MIRASALHGRSVVDIEAAKKLGEVAALLIDLPGSRIAGLVIAPGKGFMGSRRDLFLPADTVHSIGPDAIMVLGPQTTGDEFAYLTALTALPRLSDLTGRKVVTESGVLLGELTDVLLDERDRSLIGYAFHPTNTAPLFTLLKRTVRSSSLAYVRADAEVHFGSALFVVPDDAVMRVEESAVDERAAPPESTRALRAGEAPH